MGGGGAVQRFWNGCEGAQVVCLLERYDEESKLKLVEQSSSSALFLHQLTASELNGGRHVMDEFDA